MRAICWYFCWYPEVVKFRKASIHAAFTQRWESLCPPSNAKVLILQDLFFGFSYGTGISGIPVIRPGARARFEPSGQNDAFAFARIVDLAQ